MNRTPRRELRPGTWWFLLAFVTSMIGMTPAVILLGKFLSKDPETYYQIMIQRVDFEVLGWYSLIGAAIPMLVVIVLWEHYKPSVKQPAPPPPRKRKRVKFQTFGKVIRPKRWAA